MSSRKPLDFDISVSADKRRRSKQRGFVGETGTDARKCEWRGCSNAGTFRAPKSREDLDSFRWYCKDHIKDFNKSWNFYADYTPEELEAQRKAELAWERPTWKMGQKSENAKGASGHADGQAWRRFGFDDPIEVLGDNATINPGGAGEAKRARARLLPKNEQSALEVLGLGPETDRATIRAQYRALVKDLHPDMNGGKRQDEDRLRDVVWAWDQLKKSRSFSD